VSDASQHLTFAPLSASQTEQIAKNLQAQIDAIQDKFEELVGEIEKDIKNQIAQNRDGLKGANERAQNMQDKMHTLSAALDENKHDLGRATMDVSRLRSGLEQATENIVALREGHKVTTVGMQKLTTDLAVTTDVTHSVKASLEKRVFPDLEHLSDELGSTNLKVKHLLEESEMHKEALHMQKDELRKANVSIQRLNDDLAKSNTHIHLLAQRFSELAKVVKDAKQNLEDNMTTTEKLYEDQNHMNANMRNTQDAMKKMHANVVKVQDGLDRTSKDLHSTRGQLGSACNIVDSMRQGLEQTKAHVRSLREAHDKLDAKQHTVAGHLEQTALIASETKKALNQTNDLVLPNLRLDTGSAVFGGTMGMPSSARVHKKKVSLNSSLQNAKTWM